MTDPRAVVVFLGPSLPRELAREVLDADYRPPARMGDVYLALQAGVRTIVLVDGLFHGTPSVWHREIVDALAAGIRVLGAGSMGALRAAELHRLGMEGFGTVFEWYRDGAIDGDDEVALLHGPQEAGYVAFSEPLVNLRASLAAAVAAGDLDSGRASELVAAAKRSHYPERSFDALLAFARDWPPAETAHLAEVLRVHRTDVKRTDALGVLRRVADDAGPAAPTPREGLAPRSMMWELGRVLRAPFAKGETTVVGQGILAEALADARLVAELRPPLVRRAFVLDWARRAGLAPPADWVERYVGASERLHGADEGWLRANGLLRASWRALLEERALADWAVRDGEPSVLRAWASGSGVAPPSEVGPEGLVAWLTEKGPEFFGITWSFEVALLRELQVTGRAEALLEAIR